MVGTDRLAESGYFRAKIAQEKLIRESGQAVDAGRAEALCGCAPDLLIDGRFCDHVATHAELLVIEQNLLVEVPELAELFARLAEPRWIGGQNSAVARSDPAETVIALIRARHSTTAATDNP